MSLKLSFASAERCNRSKDNQFTILNGHAGTRKSPKQYPDKSLIMSGFIGSVVFLCICVIASPKIAV